MRRYALVSPEHKQNVDLRDYEDVIVNAVMEAMKDVKDVSVVVYSKFYLVSPSPDRRQAIAIGKAICKSGLCKYCIAIPKLFQSVEVLTGKEEKNDERKSDSVGGHF